MQIIDRIINIENLYWAWEKAKYFYRVGDIWFDEIEVAKFDANIHDELERIAKQIKFGQYRMSPIKPVAFPKSVDEKGPRTRQTFWVSVRDQVTWLAIINIIGPDLDCKMPSWSYAYRLFVSVFYDQDDETGKKKLQFGPYRNTSKHTFRKWSQSWPLYRRHISIVSKIMLKQKKFLTNLKSFKSEELDSTELDALEQNERVPRYFKLAYLEDGYWNKTLKNSIYWAGIDLEKFYPSINLNVIIDNIKSYYPAEKYSIELVNLINDLLRFEIDKTGWSKEELEIIGIKQKDKYLSGIPTGLFVAGFLANIALLKIDERVNKELVVRKDIAHFRFVDDHVFLSDSFESLCNWIKWYEEILRTGNIGVKINLAKTEPESLGHYLAGMDQNVNDEYSLKAKRDTELDPNFPSPLMTQTLAKVSLIAQMSFEILDESEEAQLITDIEHLLITDFPDQELRKDTRASFAASKLAQMVPNRQFDITLLYECECRIKQIDKHRLELIERMSDLSDNSPKLIELCDRIEKAEEEKAAALMERENIIEELGEQERKLFFHTYKLIVKAINDNHEKVRLWARVFEFCRKAGIGDFLLVLQTLEKLKEKNITNALSSEFIVTYIFQVLVEQVLLCYFTLIDSNSSYKSVQRAIEFFNGLVTDSFLDSVQEKYNNSKFYEAETVNLFKFTLGCVIFLFLNDKNCMNIISKERYKYLIEKYGIINWDDPGSFVINKNHELDDFVWWFIQKTANKLSDEPNKVWFKMMDYIKQRKQILNTPTGKALIALYPHKISMNIINMVIREKTDIKFFVQLGEGWMYDLIKNLNYSKDIEKIALSNKTMSRVFKVSTSNPHKYITLYDWISWMNVQCASSSNTEMNTFDPRLSEWTCLEIVRQIADLLDEKVHSIEYFGVNEIKNYKMHPANFLIPEKWTDRRDYTWDEWKDVIITERKEKIKLRNFNILGDFRYAPDTMDPYNVYDIDLITINGLGIILLQLLTKNYLLPSSWNINGLQKAFNSIAVKKAKQYQISSKTIGIIESCFSQRNRETRFIDLYQNGLLYDQDTTFDPPEIRTLKEFKNSIENSKRVLEKYQITVQNHQPRQLVPISLLQFTRKGNIYQEEVDGENECME